MYKTILAIIFSLFIKTVGSQPTNGTTGLLNIPSADMQADGTFFLGANYMPDEITPSSDFDYNTGNYYFNITFLPFLEISYRMTLLKMGTGNYNQDRSFGIRIRVLKEKKILPSLVIGGNDLYNSGGDQSTYFNSVFGVATKQFSFNKTITAFTAGYAQQAFGKEAPENLNGFFGGVAVSPGFMPALKLIGEYDTNSFNTGFSVLIRRHLFVYGFLYDFSVPVGGLAYFVYL